MLIRNHEPFIFREPQNAIKKGRPAAAFDLTWLAEKPQDCTSESVVFSWEAAALRSASVSLSLYTTNVMSS